MSNTEYDTNLNNYLTMVFSPKHSFKSSSNVVIVNDRVLCDTKKTTLNLKRYATYWKVGLALVLGSGPLKRTAKVREFVMSSEKRRLKKGGAKKD
jgi:hypothetical protein